MFRIRNYPNPFNSETVFEITLVEPNHLSFTVFDVTGWLVRVLYNDYLNSGFIVSSGMAVIVADATLQPAFTFVVFKAIPRFTLKNSFYFANLNA